MAKYTEDDLREELKTKEYEYGFYTEMDSDTFPVGLNENIVRAISKKKDEPNWMTDWRLKAYREWEKMKEPDWANVKYPSNARARGSAAHLTGSSLLPLLNEHSNTSETVLTWNNVAYGSHQFHSLYAYYPMRSMVNLKYRLIHNLNYNLKFPILEDVFDTKTWSDIERLGELGNDHPNGWVMNYTSYMFRPEWQLFDILIDPLCLHNLALNDSFVNILKSMQLDLYNWQKETSDPWIGCNPNVPTSKKEAWSVTHSETCSF